MIFYSLVSHKALVLERKRWCPIDVSIYLSIYDGMARKTGYLETILPDIAETPNFQAMLRVDERHSIRNKKSLRAF